VNGALMVAAALVYMSGKEQLAKASEWLHRAQLLADRAAEKAASASSSLSSVATVPPPPVQVQPAARAATATTTAATTAADRALPNVVCDDAVWCAVPMPAVSHFNFDGPPTDAARWRVAQAQAARGEQVLLQRVAKVFPSPWNSFLDGDKSFRGLHNLVDIFVDNVKDLDALLPGKLRRRLTAAAGPPPLLPPPPPPERPHEHRRQLKGGDTDAEAIDKSFLNPIISTEPKMWKFGAVPPPYNYREGERAPIVQLGYAAFKKDGGAYFKGSFVTFVGGPNQQEFLEAWDRIKDRIDVPFITTVALNEVNSTRSRSVRELARVCVSH